MFRPGYTKKDLEELDRLKEIDPENFDEQNLYPNEEDGERDEWQEDEEDEVVERKNKRKVDGYEKLAVLGVSAIIDGTQIVLDMFAVGVGVNRFIDIGYGIMLLFYGNQRNLLNQKTTLSIAATFIAEEIPLVDAAPFWTLDAWYLFRAGEANDQQIKSEDETDTPNTTNRHPLNSNDVRLPRK